MNNLYILSFFLLLSFSAVSQTTVCLVKGDSVLAGSTDKSRINSVKQFNFVYDGPLDTMVVNGMRFLASVAPDFKTFADSLISSMKTLQTEFFTRVLQKEPDYFNKEIMEGKTSVGSGQLCLFGFENNKPVMFRINFYMNKGVKHPIVISSSKEDESNVLFLDGPPKLKGPLTHLERGGAIMQVKREVDAWAGLDESHLVDILILTKGGKQWLRK
ncbi:MAG: hypothetical protein JST68_22280 [Bacteroidetes bacterium]|nr:hypothetical protein [Bacteroidota bacterium]